MTIFRPFVGTDRAEQIERVPKGLPPYIAQLYQYHVLTAEEEHHHFRKMNFLKFLALRSTSPEEIEQLLAEADRVRNHLLIHNLRMVVWSAKKHTNTKAHLLETISHGHMALLGAIERFDFTRGIKFSTFAVQVIRRHIYAMNRSERKESRRFHNISEEVMSRFSETRSDPFYEELVHKKKREALLNALKLLRQLDRDIVMARYGLNEGTEPQTLEHIGDALDLSRERVRQLEQRALSKLRKNTEIRKILSHVVDCE